MDRWVGVSLAALVMTGLAIVLVNRYASRPEYVYGDPVLQIPVLGFLALVGVGLVLFTAGNPVKARGLGIVAFTGLVCLAAFACGTVRVG